MRVYHFTNLKFGLDDLRRRWLKVARIADLNDPFDFLALGSTRKDVRLVLRTMRNIMSSSMGLLCFSRCWRNPVQWAHYSDGHRGLCLGFDVPDSLLKRVKYSNTRPIVDISVFEQVGDRARIEFEKLLRVKYDHWRYEQEERQFVSLKDTREESGRFFVPFSPILALRNIIVGHRCDISRAKLTEHLGRRIVGVELRKARLSFQKFCVVLQRDETQW